MKAIKYHNIKYMKTLLDEENIEICMYIKRIFTKILKIFLNVSSVILDEMIKIYQNKQDSHLFKWLESYV